MAFQPIELDPTWTLPGHACAPAPEDLRLDNPLAPHLTLTVLGEARRARVRILDQTPSRAPLRVYVGRI